MDLRSIGIVPSKIDTKDWHGFALGDYDGDGVLDLFITEGAKEGSAYGKKKDLLF
jgi:hypothetical protein